MQAKQVSLLGIALLVRFGLGSAHAQERKFEAGFLKGTPIVEVSKEKPKGREGPQGGNKSKRIALEEKRAEATTLKQAVDTVDSLTLILKSTPKGAARNSLLLNHAAALNLYARLKLVSSTPANQAATVESIKKFLLASIADANEVLQSPAHSQIQMMKAHDVAGTSYLYLDQNAQAHAHFLEVLKLNPPAEKAGRIGLMIAEDLFDQGKFQEASEFYIKYFPQMTVPLKELALYKLGWCMMNLNQPDKAEGYLARVAKSASISGVGRDAIRDLAYLVTHRTNPMASIQKAEGYFADPVDKLAFLHSVRVNFENQGTIAEHSQIVARLLAIEPDPDKQIELALANLRVQRKTVASQDHMEAFQKVVVRLSRLSSKDFARLFPKYESVIENEIQALMKSYVDTYANRVKTPETLTRAQVADSLKQQFQIFHRYFSLKSNYSAVISLWSDVCLDSKDWICVDEVSQIILSKPKELPQFAERAYLDQIAATEQFLHPTEPGKIVVKNPAAIVARRNQRIKEFTAKFPQSPQWLRVAKLHTQIEMDQGHFKEALPILDQIMAHEPTEDSLYRIQYARFKLKDYPAILADARNKPFLQPGSKISELCRESSLILAQKSKAEGNADQYKVRISEFIALSTDPAKIRIARSDYLTYLIQNAKIDEALQEVFSMPPIDSKHSDLENSRFELWKLAIDQGKFDSAIKLGALSPDTPAWGERRLLANCFKGYLPGVDDFKTLPPSEREYFLGLLALVKPSVLIQYFKFSQKRPRGAVNGSDRDLLGLSFKIELDQWRLMRAPELEAILGKDYPFVDKKNLAVLTVERQIDAIKFPDLRKLSPARQGKTVQEAIGKVQAVREQIVGGIQGKAPEVQLRTLEKAKALENQMGAYLVNSPVPTELSEEQVLEYKKGMVTASEEFTQQSAQFELLAAKVREQLDKGARWIETRSLPLPDTTQWPWPSAFESDAQLKLVKVAMQNGHRLSALTLLDYFRAKHVTSDENYFVIRSGILLSDHANSALRIYILEELEKNKQMALIAAWAKLVNRPLPETP